MDSQAQNALRKYRAARERLEAQIADRAQTPSVLGAIVGFTGAFDSGKV